VAQCPPAMLRFQFPLVEPDGRISRIRLSDKESRLGTRVMGVTQWLFAVARNALHNSWTFRVVRLSPVSRSLAASCVVLELRSLCSAGITRLHRSYEPLRHPTRPGLSLAGVRLAASARHRLGFPVVAVAFFGTCRRLYPGGTAGTLARFPDSCGGGLPRESAGSASTFEFSRPQPTFNYCYGLYLRGTAKRPFPSKASTASLPPLSLRLLPAEATSCRGRTSTRLETTTFSTAHWFMIHTHYFQNTYGMHHCRKSPLCLNLRDSHLT